MMVIAVILDKILVANPSNVLAKFLFIENCPSSCEINVSIRFLFRRFAVETSTWLCWFFLVGTVNFI